MLDVVFEVLIDSLKLLPFLFISYFIIELIEHKSSDKMEHMLRKSGIFGPAIGSALGIVPQCGFSVTASNLYAGKVITVGTLIAVFLSTSDEAIPIFLSHPDSLSKLLPIILIKFLVALVFGIIIDLFVNKLRSKKEADDEKVSEHIHHMCKDCNCDDNILLSVLKHTLNIFVFILVVSFILEFAIYFIGDENFSKILMKDSIFQPVISSLIGLIPNCASSVLLTELYLEGSISFASIISGLLTGAGIGIVVLFKINDNIKENIKILLGVYGIGVFVGIMIEIFQIFI